MLYIDQIIVYNAFYSKLTFYIKDRCQMHTLKVFRSTVWLLLHKLSSPHYHYIRKMRRGDRLPLTQFVGGFMSYVHYLGQFAHIGLCFCFVFLRLVYTMLPVSLNCPLLIAPSVFSNVYLINLFIASDGHFYIYFYSCAQPSIYHSHNPIQTRLLYYSSFPSYKAIPIIGHPLGPGQILNALCNQCLSPLKL